MVRSNQSACDPNNVYQATGHTYSISFDLPLDCGKLLTLNFTRGAGGVPPEIRRVEVPPAYPAGIDGHCLPGQGERGLVARGTVCISPGYAVIISCKQISYHDALVLGIEPLDITRYLSSMFAPTLTIGNYHMNVDWSDPIPPAPPGLVGGCFSPMSITAGTHFAINESLLVNTYRPSMYLPKK